jgi:uncharacterized membrane protein required for colicin V production
MHLNCSTAIRRAGVSFIFEVTRFNELNGGVPQVSGHGFSAWKKRYKGGGIYAINSGMNFPDTFYTIDVLFGLFVLLFGVVGLMRGLAGELARLLAFSFLLCGFTVFFPALTQLAARNWSTLSTLVVQVLVGVILWLSGVLLFFALRFSFNKLLCERIPNLVNKICGSLVGLFSGALLGLCVLSAVSLVPHEGTYHMLSERSVIGSWVCERMTPWLHPRMMELPTFDHEEN